MKRYLWLMLALFLSVLISAVVVARQHDWPWDEMAFLYRAHAIASGTEGWCHIHDYFLEHASPDPYKCDVAAARAQYIATGYSYGGGLQDYTPFGDWLNCGKGWRCDWGNGRDSHLDPEGIPMVNYGGHFYYNPVTVAMYGLAMYGRYISGDLSAQPRLMVAVARLIAMQDSKGAFPYQFAFTYARSGQTYRPGWVSGMAQGLALSLLARVYHLTSDPRYLTLGDKAFDVLVMPSSLGGTLDTLAYAYPGGANEIIFEEYPADPPGYTLNGFMYAILGVYDWSHVPSARSMSAVKYFWEAVRSLRIVLPYYDLGGFTTYDLGHIVYHKKPEIGIDYHAVHVCQLYALAYITNDPLIRKYEQLWASYVPH